MCNIHLNWDSLLSGLIGSVVGASATVLATRMIIQSSTESYKRQRVEEKKEEYEAHLKTLQNEIQFNSSLIVPNINVKIRGYSRVAWEAFLPYIHNLPVGTQRLLFDTYSEALSHERACQFDENGRNPLGSNIQMSWDKAGIGFKELEKMI